MNDRGLDWGRFFGILLIGLGVLAFWAGVAILCLR